MIDRRGTFYLLVFIVGVGFLMGLGRLTVLALDTWGSLPVGGAELFVSVSLVIAAMAGRKGRAMGVLWDAVALVNVNAMAFSIARVLNDSTQAAILSHVTAAALFLATTVCYAVAADRFDIPVLILRRTDRDCKDGATPKPTWLG